MEHDGRLLRGDVQLPLDLILHRDIYKGNAQIIRRLYISLIIFFRQDGDILQLLVRTAGELPQDLLQAAPVETDRLPEEKAGRISKCDPVAVLLLRQFRGQIHLHGRSGKRDIFEDALAKRELRRIDRALGKHGPVEGILRTPREMQHGDHLFQRHLLVVQEPDYRIMEAAQVLRYGLSFLRAQAQRKRIDKRSADLLRVSQRPAGDRRPDDKIFPARHGGHEKPVGRREQHEPGDALLAAVCIARRTGLLGQRDAVLASLEIKLLLPVEIRRKEKRLRKIRKLALPVFFILRIPRLMILQIMDIIMIGEGDVPRRLPVGLVQPVHQYGRADAVPDDVVAVQEEHLPPVLAEPESRP